MVCISENFVNDVKCSHVFHFAKNVLQKTIQLVAVCQNRDWLKSDIGILVSSDVSFYHVSFLTHHNININTYLMCE